MPLFLLSLILQVALIVHVMKTGRNTIWDLGRDDADRRPGVVLPGRGAA